MSKNLQPKKRLGWKPLICVVVSIVLMGALLAKVDFDALRETFAKMNWSWFMGAVGLFGAGVLGTSVRWHLALGRGDTAASFPATVRANYTGQFFNNILFGVSGGDVVKATLYSRWHGLEGAKVFAACIMDRLLGAIGSAIFFVLAFIVVMASGARAVIGGMDMEGKGMGAVAGGAGLVVLIAAAVFYRFRKQAFLVKTFSSLRENVQRFKREPMMMAAAVGLTVVWQAILCCILALCLRAVVDGPLPWLSIAWVFPTISVLTAIPVTFAGAGVRETAALIFLSNFGISDAEALAAGMLASFVYVIWAGVGGIIALIEESMHGGPTRGEQVDPVA